MQKNMIIYKKMEDNRIKNSHLNLTKTVSEFNKEIEKENDKIKISTLNKKIKLLQKIEILNKMTHEIKSKIHKVSMKEHKIKSVFVTFHRIRHRNLFLELIPKQFGHFISKFNKKKRENMMKEDKLVYAEVPPLPSNIKWKNYNYSSSQKFIRRVGVWSGYILMFGIRKKKFF